MISSKLCSGLKELPNGESLNIYVTGDSPNYLVMLHGMWLDHRCFDMVFPHLNKKFTIIAVDMRGHGKSSYNKPIEGINDFVEDVNLLLEYLELQKVSFYGWCWGCAVSLKFAGDYPEKVDRLILTGPVGLEGFPLYKRDKDRKTQLIEKKENVLEHTSIRNFNEAVQSKDKETLILIIGGSNFSHFHPASMETLEKLADQALLARDVGGFGWAAYTANLTSHKKWITEGLKTVEKIKCKILLLFGEEDDIIPKKAIDQFQEVFKENIKIVIYEEIGHAIAQTIPEKTSEEIIKFFDD